MYMYFLIIRVSAYDNEFFHEQQIFLLFISGFENPITLYSYFIVYQATLLAFLNYFSRRFFSINKRQ